MTPTPNKPTPQGGSKPSKKTTSKPGSKPGGKPPGKPSAEAAARPAAKAPAKPQSKPGSGEPRRPKSPAGRPGADAGKDTTKHGNKPAAPVSTKPGSGEGANPPASREGRGRRGRRGRGGRGRADAAPTSAAAVASFAEIAERQEGEGAAFVARGPYAGAGGSVDGVGDEADPSAAGSIGEAIDRDTVVAGRVAPADEAEDADDTDDTDDSWTSASDSGIESDVAIVDDRAAVDGEHVDGETDHGSPRDGREDIADSDASRAATAERHHRHDHQLRDDQSGAAPSDGRVDDRAGTSAAVVPIAPPRSQLMVVNDRPGEECRIAILQKTPQGSRLEALFMERGATATQVGNIYKGRVTNVEPAIQAAFIDFGADQAGFLHISDLHPRYFPRGDKSERIGKKIPRRDRPLMQEALRRGDEVLVQVLKQGLGTKGPTVTSYLSIPGRLLVMMPWMDKSGVSRKVEDEQQRREMRRILDSLELPDGFGFILRTAGFDRTKGELQRDAQYLLRLWEVMEKRMKAVGAPCELYTESDLLIRTIRDVVDSSIDAIVVDNESAFSRAKQFLDVVAPRSAPPVRHYDRQMPIFHAFDIERQIELIHSRIVPLPSGGALVIDQTEALVAIDVNSGRSRAARDSETNAFQTNCEAVEEIARQLRLRDLGGVIVNDLIDMRSMKHRREIEERFFAALKKDRARTTIAPISEFGILEMTRQRMRPSLRKTHYTDCPQCAGHGEVKMPDAVASDAIRSIANLLHFDRVQRVEMACSTRVASLILSSRRRDIDELEDRSGKQVEIRISEALALDRIDLYAYDDRGADIDIDKLPGPRMPKLDELPVALADDAEEEVEGGGGDRSEEGGGGRSGRRRRRRKPGPADATAIALQGGFDDIPFDDTPVREIAARAEQAERAEEEAGRAPRAAAAQDAERRGQHGDRRGPGRDGGRRSGDRPGQPQSGRPPGQGGGSPQQGAAGAGANQPQPDQGGDGEGGRRRRRRRRRRGGRGGVGPDGLPMVGDGGGANGFSQVNGAASEEFSDEPMSMEPTAPAEPIVVAPVIVDDKPRRLFELAKDLGVTSKELLAKCKEAGDIDVKNHMSALSPEVCARVRAWYAPPPVVAPVTPVTPRHPAQQRSNANAPAPVGGPGPGPGPGGDGPAPSNGDGNDEGGEGGRRRRRRRRRRGGRGGDGQGGGGGGAHGPMQDGGQPRAEAPGGGGQGGAPQQRHDGHPRGGHAPLQGEQSAQVGRGSRESGGPGGSDHVTRSQQGRHQDGQHQDPRGQRGGPGAHGGHGGDDRDSGGGRGGSPPPSAERPASVPQSSAPPSTPAASGTPGFRPLYGAGRSRKVSPATRSAAQKAEGG